MQREPSLFDEPHHAALELAAVHALGRKDYRSAFALADRRCRIEPPARAHAYVLRADALYALGETDAAIADLERALAVTPNDILANRRMLAWASGPRKTVAANALLASEREAAVLRAAIAHLRSEGRSAFAAVTVLDGAISGWAAWTDDEPVELEIASAAGTIHVPLESDPFHVLADGIGRATAFEVARPRSPHPQSIAILARGRAIHRTRAAPNERVAPAAPVKGRKRNPAGDPITVIVPVYADYEATTACIESLVLALQADRRARAVVVNDASPDARISAYLGRIASDSVSVLTNAANQGFVGSVNRALAQTRTGDVILLNSDTVVPPGFIGRLSAVASAAPEIGTVTPLSNNGEFMSFPIPNEVNPLGTREDVIETDARAAKANDGRVVDIPSGIGFCLYIKRACLDAAGLLSEDFQRGYLEDVDYCLRARSLGFRNVCAPSVFVGHAGSRSFAGEKRGLVLRNLDVLDHRFPHYRDECLAFAAIDPLAPARRAIERAAPGPERRPTLLVTGPGAVAAVARERARRLAGGGRCVFLVEVRRSAGGVSVHLSDAEGGIPQSLRFHIGAKQDNRSFSDFLSSLQPGGIEFADPAQTPIQLADLLLALGVPHTILIADAGLLVPHGANALPLLLGEKNAETAAWRRRWTGIARKAERVFAPGKDAHAFASTFLPASLLTCLPRTAEAKPVARPQTRGTKLRLGIVAARGSLDEMRLIRSIVSGLKNARPDAGVTVVGDTFDDFELMKSETVFVTGPVAPADLPLLVRGYGLQWLASGLGPPLFGHPLAEAARDCGLPLASFDWGGGEARGGDLAIAPTDSGQAIAAALVNWIGSH